MNKWNIWQGSSIIRGNNPPFINKSKTKFSINSLHATKKKSRHAPRALNNTIQMKKFTFTDTGCSRNDRKKDQKMSYNLRPRLILSTVTSGRFRPYAISDVLFSGFSERSPKIADPAWPCFLNAENCVIGSGSRLAFCPLL